MFLNPEQMIELTGRERYGAQVRALRSMGIDHLIRPDGRPLVLFEKLVSGQHHRHRPKKNEPNWSHVNAASKP